MNHHYRRQTISNSGNSVQQINLGALRLVRIVRLEPVESALSMSEYWTTLLTFEDKSWTWYYRPWLRQLITTIAFFCIPQESRALDFHKTHTQSQILGLGILVAATLFSLGLVCIRRCCFEDDTFPNVDEFEEMEKQITGDLFRERLYAVLQEDAKKRISDVFQIRTPREMKDAFRKAREALADVNHRGNRHGRYDRLNLDDEDTELQLMDSTHLWSLYWVVLLGGISTTRHCIKLGRRVLTFLILCNKEVKRKKSQSTFFVVYGEGHLTIRAVSARKNYTRKGNIYHSETFCTPQNPLFSLSITLLQLLTSE